MYLSKLTIKTNRVAAQWLANPYRIHQRMMKGCDGDGRVLFRVEEEEGGARILVQSLGRPDWAAAFADLDVLAGAEWKEFDGRLGAGQVYRFRLLANPTVKRAGKRLGLLKTEEQEAWLRRKLAEGGMRLEGCLMRQSGFLRSRKEEDGAEVKAVHYSVLFEGMLVVLEVEKAEAALGAGIGSGKGFGFGLLSLGRA